MKNVCYEKNDFVSFIQGSSYAFTACIVKQLFALPALILSIETIRLWGECTRKTVKIVVSLISDLIQQ